MPKQQRQLTEFKLDPTNPREIKPAALRGLGVAMADFGDLSGIVWNAKTEELVCGHQRFDRLKTAGAKEWTQVSATEGYVEHPETRERFGIRIVDWERAKQQVANIVANNPELQGTFEADTLQEQLEALQSEEHFEELRLRELIEEEKEPRERKTLDDFETNPSPKKVWILIATSEEAAPDIEATLRERFEGPDTRIEVSVGAK